MKFLTNSGVGYTLVTSMNNNEKLITYQTHKLRKLLAEVHNCCRERVIFEAKKLGIPASELKCLMFFENHRYLTANEIADLLDVAKSRTTVIVDGLEKKGLVLRESDPNDARVKLISLTAAGQRKLREIEDFLLDLHAQLLERIDPVQRSTIIAALETLRSSMEELKRQLA